MQGILFDLDDTLYDMAEPFVRAYERLFPWAEAPVMGVLTAHRKYSDEVFDASQSGEITMEEMYIYRMKKAMADYGIPISAGEALDFQREYAQNQGRITLDTGMRSVLELCRRKGLVTGLVTNGGSEHQWEKIVRLGLREWMPRENIFISGEVGTAKPDPEIYRFAQKRLGLEAKELLYVGDTYNNDVIAAKRAGWSAVWYNCRGYPMPEGEIRPDGIVKSAAELFACLEKRQSEV